MMKRKNIVNMTALRQRARIVAGRLLCFLSMFQCFNVSILSLTSCEREPLLHLYDARELEIQMPEVELELDVLWDYELSFDVHYDWKAEWFYDWDDEDRNIFGELGYAEPTVFNLRRYYTGSEAYAPHTHVHAPPPIQGRYFRDRFDWGYWDLLAWNDIQTLDGVQSLIFDEETSLDSVSLREKGIHSVIDGQADALIFPDIVAGNVFYKTITLFGYAKTAGVLQGTQCCCVLPSRADSPESKYYSLALAAI